MSVSVLSQFLARNKISRAKPLPLVHTTESYFLKKIIGSEKLEASPCSVFKGEKLSYFFVGRASYKKELNQEAEYWELPTCMVFDFFCNGAKRVFPFDSGAFKGKRYPNFVNMMALNDFDISNDADGPEKIIGTFFGSARNYYKLSPVNESFFESQFEVDVLDEEIKALYKLIKAKDQKFDDRRFSIEMQFPGDLLFEDRKPILAIFPETYLADQSYIDRITALGAEILTYPVFPLRKEYYYYAIYEKLDQFYSKRGYYGI